MATPEQINVMVQVAVEASVSRLMEGLMPMIAANVNTGGGGTQWQDLPRHRKIRRRRGRVGRVVKFGTTVKEYDAGLFQALEMAGDSEVEIDMTEGDAEQHIAAWRSPQCFTIGSSTF